MGVFSFSSARLGPNLKKKKITIVIQRRLFPMDKYFYRDFQLASRDATLEFSQYTIGDVGCVVWDAALVLAGYFDRLSKSRSFENANILELGSGTGCVGLVLAADEEECEEERGSF